MFESFLNDARGPARRGTSVLASICLHGLFVGLAAITYVKTRLPRSEKAVEVSFRPLPPAAPSGHKTKLPRLATHPPVLPKVRPQIIIQPRQAPKAVAKADPAPVLLSAGMSRPRPVGECAPGGARPRPSVPEQARALGLGGNVLVEYVVRSDGTVAGVALKNSRAPQLLFQATRKWLEACPFSPSLSGGRPVPVRVVQQFHFRLQ
jgi:TonB family protein